MFGRLLAGEAFFWSLFHRNRFAHVGKRFRLIRPTIIANPQNITIGDMFWAWNRLRLTAITQSNEQSFSPVIQIGDRVNLLFDVHITCINRIEIHDDVLIASRVLITDHSHGSYSGPVIDSPYVSPVKRNLVSAGPTIVERNCWIGEGAAILAGVRIGEGSVIGSNSVVTKSVPAYTIAAGVPARPLKRYSQDSNIWIDVR